MITRKLNKNINKRWIFWMKNQRLKNIMLFTTFFLQGWVLASISAFFADFWQAQYMKIINIWNDQQVHEIQISFNHMTECQQKQSLQLQLLTSDSLIFWLKTAHLAVFKLESAILFLIIEFNQYTFVCASIASFSCHVTSLLLSAEHEMSLSLKYCICHAIRIMKILWHEWIINFADNSSVDMLNSKWNSQ